MEKTKSVFILMDSSENVKTFSNLKILCETMQNNTEGFPSYWTLTRENFKGSAFLEVKTKQGEVFKILDSDITYPPKQNKKGSDLLIGSKE